MKPVTKCMHTGTHEMQHFHGTRLGRGESTLVKMLKIKVGP